MRGVEADRAAATGADLTDGARRPAAAASVRGDLITCGCEAEEEGGQEEHMGWQNLSSQQSLPILKLFGTRKLSPFAPLQSTRRRTIV